MTMNFCPKCGTAKVNATAQFCHVCGESLVMKGTTGTEVTPSTPTLTTNVAPTSSATQTKCPVCNGSGEASAPWLPSKKEPCRYCKGTGYITETPSWPSSNVTQGAGSTSSIPSTSISSTPAKYSPVGSGTNPQATRDNMALAIGILLLLATVGGFYGASTIAGYSNEFNSLNGLGGSSDIGSQLSKLSTLEFFCCSGCDDRCCGRLYIGSTYASCPGFTRATHRHNVHSSHDGHLGVLF